MMNVVKKWFVFVIILACITLCVPSCFAGTVTPQPTLKPKSDGNTLRESASNTPPQEEWNKTFGGSRDDAAYDVQQTKDAGYIIDGYAKSFGVAATNPWLIKIDASGTMQWNRTFDYYALPSVSGYIRSM